MSALIAVLGMLAACAFCFGLGLFWRVFDAWEARVADRIFTLTSRAVGDDDRWCETPDADCSIETCGEGCQQPGVFDTPGGRAYLENLERMQPTQLTRDAIRRVRANRHGEQ